MAFREVSVIQVRKVLRLWLRGEGLRSIERLTSLDRKTVRRYRRAAEAAGATADGGEAQLTDELIAAVVERVRPARPRGPGAAWEACQRERDRIKKWLDDDVPVARIVHLLARRGVHVPERTLHRFCAEELGHRRQRTTVRVAVGEPGHEVQVDFGRLGYLVHASGARRLLRALIFTAVFSRHMFVWLSHPLPAATAHSCQTVPLRWRIMARTPPAPVQPSLLIWARKSIGLSVEDAARKVPVAPARLEAYRSDAITASDVAGYLGMRLKHLAAVERQLAGSEVRLRQPEERRAVCGERVGEGDVLNHRPAAEVLAHDDGGLHETGRCPDLGVEVLEVVVAYAAQGLEHDAGSQRQGREGGAQPLDRRPCRVHPEGRVELAKRHAAEL
jgi:hypothetical protein